MTTPILMPQVGQDLQTGTLVEWKVKVNDQINKGDIVAIVESDKAVFEVEAFESGVVLKLLYNEGDEAAVLKPIAFIGQPGEKPEVYESEMEQKSAEPVKPAAPVVSQDIKSTNKKVLASPSARRWARENNIDLNTVTGSGTGGRIIREDVLKCIDNKGVQIIEREEFNIPQQPRVNNEELVPFSKMRQRIATQLTLSKQTIPHFYLFMDVDMTAALAWRIVNNKGAQIKVTVSDVIIKSVALSLKKFKQLNIHVEKNGIIPKNDINIGVAVSTREGLLVPVIANADKLGIRKISAQSRENAENARKGILKPGGLATFTISNLGMFDINSFIPIINPPEAMILGVGMVEKRIVALENNSFGTRDMMSLTLVCDHRAVDGATAAHFLQSVKQLLEHFNM